MSLALSVTQEAVRLASIREEQMMGLFHPKGVKADKTSTHKIVYFFKQGGEVDKLKQFVTATFASEEHARLCEIIDAANRLYKYDSALAKLFPSSGIPYDFACVDKSPEEFLNKKRAESLQKIKDYLQQDNKPEILHEVVDRFFSPLEKDDLHKLVNQAAIEAFTSK